MNSTEYKKFHESFIQNNNGSTAVHTFLCIFFTVQCSLLCAVRDEDNGLEQYTYEYIIIVVPMIVIHTLLSKHVFILNFIAFMFLLAKIYKMYDNVNIKLIYERSHSNSSTRIQSITCLRALTYLITGFAILAVDFQDFPRHLAKTETYGYSLMDTGVGLFVLMSGLVHKDTYKNNYLEIFKDNFKFISILVILGIIRFVSVKKIDYHEHISEYGVHWNFFFTLALCKLISTILLLLFKNSLFLSTFVITIHEYFLFMGLQDWVFSDTNRINLVDANREGISSCLGYVSLYLFAAHLKSELNKKDVNRLLVLRKLGIYSILFIMSSYLVNIFRPISRTLANASYCMYLSTLLTTILSFMYFIEILNMNSKKPMFRVPKILNDINYNGLIYFLISNLTTGIVNMLFQTLLMSFVLTFILLNVYMFFNIIVIVYLKRKKIKI